ncbi:hypothetical protein M569_08869, partial [Genlisea aurea]
MGGDGESSVDLAEAELVNVNIRSTNGSKFSVNTSLESTVGEFKVLLAQNCDIPAEQQRLIYKGRILKDDQTLASYGLQASHTIHMVRGFAAAASPPSNASASAGNTNSSPAATQSPNAGGLGAAAGAAAPLFPGFGVGALNGNGVSGLFAGGLPDFEQVQQQLTQNPNIMRDIINMPAIQSLMNNPEIMRNLIMNNPQMREIIDRNPELAHILNDPSILRQTLEAARNPEIMREMMRNTDRAMSNLEASPEGFNMLRRMYENVQEPFLNATTMGGNSAAAGTNPFAALLGSQGVAQTRDGSNLNAASENGTGGAAVPNANPLPNPWSSTGGSQANNAARTNPAANTRLPPITGLGGLGLPHLDPSVLPDPSSFGQLLQNPAVAQMMQSLLSNPQYFEQILGLNPQLRSMVDMNPQLREMMQNSEFLRDITSPTAMQQMLALQQQLSQLSRQQPTLDGGRADQGTRNNIGLDMLMNMFGGLGAGALTPNEPNIPPEELYATQLSQLQEMGFFDTQENIRALRATAGNVHAAVERLLGNP